MCNKETQHKRSLIVHTRPDSVIYFRTTAKLIKLRIIDQCNPWNTG